ncbi:hypothetical protein Tco_0796843 [Tanacetum coccineum]
MAQSQRQADVHQDELCPPNKRYVFMDANKKIDLDNPLCPNESKILVDILQNHPLRFSIVASASVPWIYLGQFWHTLKEDGSKYRLKFVLDRKEITLTFNDFRIIFQLLHATDNNHERFVNAPNLTPRQLAPLGHNPDINEGESSAQRKFTVIRLHIPPRWSTRLIPPTPIPTAVEADDIILQDTIQLSITEQKSCDELEARKNVKKVEKYLIAEEIEKLVKGTENVDNDEVVNSVLNNKKVLSTRLEPRSHTKSPEVEKTTKVQPVNTIEEEEESAEDDYELRRMEKGKNVEDSRHTPSPTTTRSPRIHSTLISSDTEKLQELTVNDPPPSSSTPSSSLSKLSATQRLLSLFLARQKFNVLAQHLQEIMEESLPKMVDDCVKELTKKQVPLYVAEGLIMKRKQNQTDVAKMIADAIQ